MNNSDFPIGFIAGFVIGFFLLFLFADNALDRANDRTVKAIACMEKTTDSAFCSEQFIPKD